MPNVQKLINFGRKVHLFAAKGPGYHYAYGRWRFNRLLRQKFSKPLQLNDKSFFAYCNLKKLGINTGETKEISPAIKTKICQYFQTRTEPYFCLEHEPLEQLRTLIKINQIEATIHSANAICDNIFYFRRVEPVKFEHEVDWLYCPLGNTDWRWDLNRHTYFETLGRAYWYTNDEKYARKFRNLFLDWLANNPAYVNHPNWSSVFEVAFRINTWIWAFYFFRRSATFNDQICLAFLKGLLAHGLYLDANLETHSQNNHLLLEAKSLVMLGLLFPEFKAAEKWYQRGLKILYRGIKAQVYPDGVHCEQATHYHRVIAGELLELLVLLDNNNVSIPSEIVEAFSRMVEFEVWITKPDGLIPLFGDSALEDTHMRFSAAFGGPIFLDRYHFESTASCVDETTVWLLGHKRVKSYLFSSETMPYLNSRAFPQGGYFVMRHGQGEKAHYLVFDCGPFGHKPDPYHGHADALSFELYAFGQTLLVDSGVYSTHMGQAWRRFFRSSRAHNTVVVDNQDQSILPDSRRVYRPAQTTLYQWISNEHFDFVDGSHNGYERLSNPVKHRRQIFFAKPKYWIVIDSLTGQGEHCFDLYFHLMPNMDVSFDLEAGQLRAENDMHLGFIMTSLATNNLQTEIITGNIEPIQGWVSFFSGEKQPAPTVRYRQNGTVPVQFCTLIYPHAIQNTATVSLLDVQQDQDSSTNKGCLTSLRIETGDYVDYLIVDRNPIGSRKFFCDYETAGQLVYIHHKKENNHLVAEKIFVKDGRQLLFKSQPFSNFERNKRK